MEKTNFRYCPECKAEYETQIEFCSDCNVTLVGELPLDIPLDQIEWVEAGQFSGKMYGEMAGEILAKNNIPYFLKSDFFSSAFNITPANLPGTIVKLFVPEYQKKIAEQLIMNIAD
ncbi:MAG: hypothetical protein ACE5D0_03575 [Fidelibacterota bacterium]